MLIQSPTTVFIAAISSDIGKALAAIYRARGWSVIGTYREAARLGDLERDPGVSLYKCDVESAHDIDAVAGALADRGQHWDLFIGAVGQLAPIGPFFEVSRDQWVRSVQLNGIAQLALLHSIFPFRLARPYSRVAMLVGGAINRSFPNYSAYSLGKLGLVKFCELIHDECPDIHAIAIGTGWVATKIHNQTLEAASAAGDNLMRTQEFLSRGETGTSISDIAACIDWCFAQSRDATGGRNFSVVHDPWRGDGVPLAEALESDSEKFKLRRFANSSPRDGTT